MSIVLPTGQDNLKKFPCILFKFVMHVTNKQFSAPCILFKFVMHVTNKQFLD